MPKYWALINLAFIFSLVSCQEKEKLGQASYSDMTVSVYASVTVQPESLHKVFPEASGKIIELRVEEGDLLEKGDKFATIEPIREQFDLEAARLQEELASERLKGQSSQLQIMKTEINKLIAQRSTDSVNYFRLKNLWDQNIGSKIDLDQARLKYEISSENLKAAKEQLNLTEKELENQLKQSRVNSRRTLSLLDNYDIFAEAKTRVYKLFKEQGEAISIQEPLVELGHPDEFVLEMQIDEVDIAALNTGQKVIITLDAYPDQSWNAVVTKIYPSKDQIKQSFKVEAQFEKEPPRLYAGLAGEANIIIQEREDVLTVPLEYLDSEGRLTDANGKKLDVKFGHRNLQTIEVISGIDTTTQLRMPQ